MPQHASNNLYIHIQYVLCFLWLITTQLVISNWCQNLDKTSVTDLQKVTWLMLHCTPDGVCFYRAVSEKVPIPKQILLPDLSHELRNWNYVQESQESCKVTLPVHPEFFLPPPHWFKTAWEKDDWRGFWMQITLNVHEHGGFELVGYINTDENKTYFVCFKLWIQNLCYTVLIMKVCQLKW